MFTAESLSIFLYCTKAAFFDYIVNFLIRFIHFSIGLTIGLTLARSLTPTL
jgi:hypothetical protein